MVILPAVAVESLLFALTAPLTTIWPASATISTEPACAADVSIRPATLILGAVTATLPPAVEIALDASRNTPRLVFLTALLAAAAVATLPVTATLPPVVKIFDPPVIATPWLLPSVDVDPLASPVMVSAPAPVLMVELLIVTAATLLPALLVSVPEIVPTGVNDTGSATVWALPVIVLFVVE